MPPLETACRNQKAVLWMANGFDSFGERKVNAAVSIDVRWETKTGQTLDAQNNIVAIESNAVVDRDIVIGSILWLGNIDDIATPPVDLRQVVGFGGIPDVKGRNTRRTVLMTRFSDELPALA